MGKFNNVSARELPLYIIEENAQALSCEGCRNGEALPFDFTMAFQPLVDLERRIVFAYEGLVRGLSNEPAYTVIEKVKAEHIYRFDQACRVKAVALAAAAGISERLNINFIPGAIYRPEICIQTTLNAARRYGFPLSNITFEVVESTPINDRRHLQRIIDHHKKLGFATALDDFGSGYANLDWLADLSPDSIKIDMHLIRDIDTNRRKKAIVHSLTSLCRQLEIEVLAEGVETKAERDTLAAMGVVKQQGYFFGKPQFESFATIASEVFC
ncbi:EAL domain-containing protein [Salinimonas marina]|uniref:EAL domain-containing protein n=1 Tax=Salinimonas marina TaxID=2785918 RepID=A0A7S9DXI1_9ALTE|nr:EAL domain-containing protein [Salinimonas marina]QPG05784.1 EAL domain-containing protein [Salinimonas marina]